MLLCQWLLTLSLTFALKNTEFYWFNNKIGKPYQIYIIPFITPLKACDICNSSHEFVLQLTFINAI